MLSQQSYFPLGGGFPFLGLNSSFPATVIKEGHSPVCSNVQFEDGVLKKRSGYTGFYNLPTTDPVIGIIEHQSLDGTKTLFAVTTKDHFKLVTSGAGYEWFCVDNTVDETTAEAGAGTRSYDPLADCEDETDWTNGANVTLDNDEVNYKKGSASLEITVTAGAGVQVFAYMDAFSALDLVRANAVGFWIRSSINLVAADLTLVVDETAGATEGGGAGTFQTFELPALVAATWTYVLIDGDFAGLQAVITVGLKGKDKGACVILLDDIRALVRWTGTQDNLLSFDEGFDGSNMVTIATNGNDDDAILYWDTSNDSFQEFPLNVVTQGFETVYGGFTYVKQILFFYNHLMFANYYDTASRPRNIAWSEDGDVDDWLNGDAGYNPVTDCSGDILLLKKLGNQVVIYAEESIGVCSFIEGTSTFSFDQRIFNTRVSSPRCVVDLGPYHLFMSDQGFFLFDGSEVIKMIGQEILTEFKENLNKEYMRRSFAYHDVRDRRVYFFIPTESSSLDTCYLLEYDPIDQKNNRWSKFSFQDEFFAMGYFSSLSILTWETDMLATLSWEDFTTRWKDVAVGEGEKLVLVGSTEGAFFYMNKVVFDDSSTPVEASWESKDFTLPMIYRSQQSRILEFEIEAKGDSIDFSYSVDQGLSWVSVAVAETLTTEWSRVKFYFDVVAETIRFKLTNNRANQTFSMRWFRAWLSEDSSV